MGSQRVRHDLVIEQPFSHPCDFPSSSFWDVYLTTPAHRAVCRLRKSLCLKLTLKVRVTFFWPEFPTVSWKIHEGEDRAHKLSPHSRQASFAPEHTPFLNDNTFQRPPWPTGNNISASLGTKIPAPRLDVTSSLPAVLLCATSQNGMKRAFVLTTNPFWGRQNQTHCQNCDTTSSAYLLKAGRGEGRVMGNWIAGQRKEGTFTAPLALPPPPSVGGLGTELRVFLPRPGGPGLSLCWAGFPTELPVRRSRTGSPQPRCQGPESMQGPSPQRNGHGKVQPLPLSITHIICTSTFRVKALKSFKKKKDESVSRSVLSPFVTPWTVACQALLSMGFSRQEYWSVVPFPPPGDLHDPGIEPRSPALQVDSLPAKPPGKPFEM